MTTSGHNDGHVVTKKMTTVCGCDEPRSNHCDRLVVVIGSHNVDTVLAQITMLQQEWQCRENNQGMLS